METKADNQPLVSVIVLSYNSAKYLLETLDSIKKQTYKNIELIISDDASTDDTVDICKNWIEYNKNRFVKTDLITVASNTGVVQNYYRAIKKCKGKFIAQIGADDYWTDYNKLHKQVEFLVSNNTFGMVHTEFDVLTRDGKLIKNYNRNKNINIPDGYIFPELLYPPRALVKASTVMFVNNVVDLDNIFYNSIKRNWQLEDLQIWFEISLKKKIGYINDSTTVYRIHNQSISNTKDQFRSFLLKKSVFEIRFYYWEKYSKDEKIRKELDILYSKVIISYGLIISNKNKLKKAFNFLKRYNIKISPKDRIKYYLSIFGIKPFRNTIDF